LPLEKVAELLKLTIRVVLGKKTGKKIWIFLRLFISLQVKK
jgi:hypothetical protein